MLRVCLFVRLSALSVCLFVCLSALSVCLSVCLLCLSVSLSVCSMWNARHFFCFEFWSRSFFSSVLCLIFYTTKCIKYRAERPPFFLEFWSTTEYPYSAPNLDEIRSSFSVFFCTFVCVVGGGYPLRPVGAHGGSETISG